MCVCAGRITITARYKPSSATLIIKQIQSSWYYKREVSIPCSYDKNGSWAFSILIYHAWYFGWLCWTCSRRKCVNWANIKAIRFYAVMALRSTRWYQPMSFFIWRDGSEVKLLSYIFFLQINFPYYKSIALTNIIVIFLLHISLLYFVDFVASC